MTLPPSCAYCGDPDAPDLDHIQPVSRGGPRAVGSNTTPACKRCNGSKGGRTPDEWYRSQSLQARIAVYHARRKAPAQLALRLDIPDWWIDVRVALGDELWRRFGRAITPRGRQGRHSAVSRSVLIRDFMEWMVRAPGSKPPRRPGVTRTATADHGGPPPDSAA